MQAKPIVRGFVGAVIEDLEELGSAQVKHELRVKCELLAEAERIRVVLVVVSKLLTLQPTENTHFYPDKNKSAAICSLGRDETENTILAR